MASQPLSYFGRKPEVTGRTKVDARVTGLAHGIQHDGCIGNAGVDAHRYLEGAETAGRGGNRDPE